MVVRIRPPTCGLPVTIHEFVVYWDPTGCLTAFCFSPFEVRDDSNPSGDGLSHLNRIKSGGAATPIPSATLRVRRRVGNFMERSLIVVALPEWMNDDVNHSKCTRIGVP